MKRIKGDMIEEANIDGSDNLEDAIDEAEQAFTETIKAVLKRAVDDMDMAGEIDLRQHVTKAINAEINDAIENGAYMHLSVCDGGLQAYVSLPIGFGSENEPSWTFDLTAALDELADGFVGDRQTDGDREAITTIRDALLRAAEKFNSIIRKP